MGLFDKLTMQLYFTIDKGFITVQKIGSDERFETKTNILFDTKSYTTISVGTDTTPAKGQIVKDGFNNDRMVIGDFTAAISCCDHIIKKFLHNPFIRPIIIVKVLRKFQNELTLVELKSIIETFESAGARKVFIWQGDEFNENELQNWSRLKQILENEPQPFN